MAHEPLLYVSRMLLEWALRGARMFHIQLNADWMLNLTGNRTYAQHVKAFNHSPSRDERPVSVAEPWQMQKLTPE